jgi:hypothetical protein
MLRKNHADSGKIVEPKQRFDPYAFLACPLLLVCPFVIFVKSHQYPYLAPEILICTAVLFGLGLLCSIIIMVGGKYFTVIVIAGLITLFLDLQFDWGKNGYLASLIGALALSWLLRRHLLKITTAMLLTILVSTLALPSAGQSSQAVTVSPRTTSRADLPLVLHIVLDGHVAIEGIPKGIELGRKLRERITSFYTSNGFHTFGRSYSLYQSTDDSVSNLFNFSAEPVQLFYYDEIVEPRPLTNNMYFSSLARQGYELNIYQSQFLDYCGVNDATIYRCFTYGSGGISPARKLEDTVGYKALLIGSIFADLSGFYRTFRQYYRRSIRRWIGEMEFLWLLDRPRVGGIASMSAIDQLTTDLGTARKGSFFFAHLLLPHQPWLYTTECELRPLNQWKHAYQLAAGLSHIRYLEQLNCVYNLLETLFLRMREKNIYDDSIIVLHGDHGSRIKGNNIGSIAYGDKSSSEDYVQQYSTLFAVKMPSHVPSYDMRMASIHGLLKQLVQSGWRLDVLSDEESPYVFVPKDGSKRMIKIPLPDF